MKKYYNNFNEKLDRVMHDYPLAHDIKDRIMRDDSTPKEIKAFFEKEEERILFGCSMEQNLEGLGYVCNKKEHYGNSVEQKIIGRFIYDDTKPEELKAFIKKAIDIAVDEVSMAEEIIDRIMNDDTIPVEFKEYVNEAKKRTSPFYPMALDVIIEIRFLNDNAPKELKAFVNKEIERIRHEDTNEEELKTQGFDFNEKEHYEEYEDTYAQGVEEFSDEDINDIFDGCPDAYWNID